MSSPTGSATLWAVTHLLAVLNVVFGLMLYVDPDFYTVRETAPMECGIITTSRDDGHLDSITVFFFRGEGSFKLAISLFTLIVSKIVVSSGNATSEHATEFCAAMFLAILLPAILVWYINTDPFKADIFDASKYRESMVMASVLCTLLVIGLYQSSPRQKEKVKLTRIQEACAFFIASGAFFAILLLWNPEASFAPGGIQPLFTSTDYKNNLFDPVMMYAGRMLGATHCVFLVALWYLSMEPVLVSTLVLTIVALLFPLDILSVFGGSKDVMNRPMMLFFIVLHTACIAVNYKSVAVSASLKSAQKKKQ